MGFAQGCFALLFIHFRHPGVIQRFCLLTLLKSAGPLNRWDRKKQFKYKILKRRKTEIKHSCLTKYLKKRKKEDTVIMKGKKALKLWRNKTDKKEKSFEIVDIMYVFERSH